MKIEDYIKSLPENIISGEDVQLPDHSFREIFEFVGIGEKDVFYHLGCGDGNGVAIALQKFNVKKAIGIDYNEEKIQQCNKIIKEKNRKEKEVPDYKFNENEKLDDKYRRIGLMVAPYHMMHNANSIYEKVLCKI